MTREETLAQRRAAYAAKQPKSLACGFTILRCKKCRAAFLPTPRQRLYCSNRCNVNAQSERYRRRKRPRRTETRTCAVCPRRFKVEVPSRQQNQVYCSNACKARVSMQKVRARRARRKDIP